MRSRVTVALQIFKGLYSLVLKLQTFALVTATAGLPAFPSICWW